MKILIVNDDGIHAPGIRALWEALEPLAECTIVAPSHDMSGKGMGITMEDPLHLREVEWAGAQAYSVSGTPADCVRIGLMSVCEKPDLVLSGINLGCNAGRNILYSGTVGAAMEAAYHGLPAAAISTVSDCSDFVVAGKQIPNILQFLLDHPLPIETILNINIPDEVKGFRFARQGRSYWRHRGVERDHPEGHRYFWPMGEPSGCAEAADSDVALLGQGYVTAVPIRTHEMTCHESFKKFFESSFLSAHPTEQS